jgi:excisionase family DNA binding protein
MAARRRSSRPANEQPVRQRSRDLKLGSTGLGEDSLVDIAEVAVRLGVEVRHVRRLVYEGRIPYVKWGKLLRFEPAEIEGWLDQRRRGPAA